MLAAHVAKLDIAFVGSDSDEEGEMSKSNGKGRLLASTQIIAVAAEQPPLHTLASWVENRYGGRWELRGEVLKLIRNYQSTPDDPRPFVGRADVLGQLDQWLLQQADRLMLLSGAAGRGKTALLLHWMEGVIQCRPALTVFYCPISIRFKTADETSGVQLLFAALCDAFKELHERLPQRPDHRDYLDGIASAWQLLRSRPQDRFLLVVDGLDEAASPWFLERGILPPEIPPNLHVLMAARRKPGHASDMAWLNDLFQRDGGGNGSQHAVLEVDRLGREAMAEAVIQLRSPADRLIGRRVFLDVLYRLTDRGDPLLLTLWLGQIWKKHDGLPDLHVDALASLQPGFDGLYGNWMKDQEALWREHGMDVHMEDFEQVMQVLALAQGPLLLCDLVNVLGHLSRISPWDASDLRTMLDRAHRLVVGDGEQQGYVFVHPRLAHHFQEKLNTDPRWLCAVRRAFGEWRAQCCA
jgi:hypothetical protein